MTTLPKALHLYSAIARRQYITPHTPASAASAFPKFQPRSLTPCTYRNLSTSSRLTYPRKDSQHKDSINTEATEYSKSATDDEGARQEEAAFDPSITDPEQQKEKAGEGNGDSSNPLDVSPANPEVSKQRGQQEGGAQMSSGGSRERTSGGSSPKKGSKVA